MDEMIAKIKSYLRIVNKSYDEIEQDNTGLIDFVIGEVADRVSLYLGCDTIPTKLERVLANIVNTGLTRCLKAIELTKEGATDVDADELTLVLDTGDGASSEYRLLYRPSEEKTVSRQLNV